MRRTSELVNDGFWIAILYLTNRDGANLHEFDSFYDDALYVVAGNDEAAVSDHAIDSALELMAVYESALGPRVDFDLRWIDLDEFVEDYSSGDVEVDVDRVHRIANGEIVYL